MKINQAAQTPHYAMSVKHVLLSATTLDCNLFLCDIGLQMALACVTKHTCSDCVMVPKRSYAVSWQGQPPQGDVGVGQN